MNYESLRYLGIQEGLEDAKGTGVSLGGMIQDGLEAVPTALDGSKIFEIIKYLGSFRHVYKIGKQRQVCT